MKRIAFLVCGLLFCSGGIASAQVLLSLSCSTMAGPSAIGVSYSAQCTASGGIPPYTWSISGTVPNGVTFTPNSPDNTGSTVIGTPTAAEDYNYTIQVADTTGLNSQQQNYTGTVFGINSISPTSATAGATGVTLTVSGAGFGSDSVVNFNGTAVPTTVTPGNSTQVTAAVPGSLLTTPGTVPVTLTSGGATSNSQTFTINPPPVISSINPTSTAAGGPAFTLTVNGSGFGADSMVSFNGTALTPSSITPAQVVVTVPANLITTPGTFPVTLTSGGVTSSANFTVVAPAITSINPSSVTAGGSTFQLIVKGSGFAPASVVQWTVSGTTTTLSTSFVSSTQVTATVPSNLIAAQGSAQISVETNSVTSNSETLTIVPGPTLSGLNPNTTTAGSATFTLIASGTGFASGAMVLWNGSPLSTTFQSANELTATVPANLVASAGTAQVSVSSGGVTSNSLTFTIVAAPTISSINPNTITAGSSDFTMTVTGTGFASGAAVNWNGVALGTVFNSSTQLTASVPSSDVTTPGTIQVTVTSGGVTSNSVSFTIVAGPAIASLNPPTVTAGGAAFTLQVDGSGFASGSIVQWNGSALTTNVLSANELTAAVPASNISRPGSVQITVKSSGVTSNSATLTIVAGPALASLNPNTITAGSATFTLIANGTGFASGGTVNWNGSPLSTTFQSANELDAVVPANLVASVGTAQVSVSSGGVMSESLTFTIVSGPTISSLSPNTITAGSPAFTLTVNGSGFASGASVKWNGTALPTLLVSATQLTASVPASDVASAGTAHVTVTSGGVTSNSIDFTVVAGPAITTLMPSTITAGTGAFILTVNGTGFASGATVLWNTSSLTTTFKSATQLTASVPASDIASPQTVSVSVKSGGVTSNTLSFTVVAGPALTSLSPATITGGSGAGLGPVGNCPGNISPAGTLTINGSGFVSGATGEWNGQALTTTFVSSTQLTACVSYASIQGYGTATITVSSQNITSNPLQITLALPAISFTGLQSTSAPTQQLQVGLQFASATAKSLPLEGTLKLSFSTTAPGVPAGYMDPALQFSSGGTTLNFSIPAGSSSISLGSIQQGTVEGTITVTLSSLTWNGTNVLSSPLTGTVAIPPLPPVITAGSVQITNLTASGFDVVLTGYSVTRDMKTANFSFTAAAGTQFTGTTTFSVDVSAAFTDWYNSASSQPEGSLFLLTVPFTISGPTSVLGSVSVTLTNTVGTSAPVSASP